MPMMVALFCSWSSMELSLVRCWRERSLPLSRFRFDCVFLIVGAASMIIIMFYFLCENH